MKKLLIATTLSTLLLSGCGLFKSDHAWERAKQERPLEIPQGMDRPDVSDAVTIPRVNDQPTDTASNSVDRLPLGDAVPVAYQRVGKALDDAGVGTVVSRDDATHSYRVDLGAAASAKKKGFFSRLFGSSDDTSSKPDLAAPHLGGEVTVSVKPAATGGSTVSVAGDGGDVALVAAALRARLGG